jgi:hypothetical protein
MARAQQANPFELAMAMSFSGGGAGSAEAEAAATVAPKEECRSRRRVSMSEVQMVGDSQPILAPGPSNQAADFMSRAVYCTVTQ